MAKLLAFLCIALLVVTMVMSCKPPGVICSEDSECCTGHLCHPWAGRCVKQPDTPWGPGGPWGAAWKPADYNPHAPKDRAQAEQ